MFLPADKIFLLYTDRSPYSFRLDGKATGFWAICSGYLQLAKESWDRRFLIKDVFFSPEVDNINIKSKVSAFFLPLPVYLPFIALLSLLFACLQGLKKA